MHDLRSLMSSRGVRCTRQREGVFSALACCKSHPTAEELHRIANTGDDRRSTDGPERSLRPAPAGPVSLATVYNTLDALCRAGLVRRLPAANGGSGGGARYEADLTDHLHLTLSDGRVRDVP